MTQVKFDGTNFGEVAAALAAMQARAQNVLPAWDELLTWLARQNAMQFRGEGARYGTKWRPLARSTLESKIARGRPRDILVDSGDLRRGLIRRPFRVEIMTPHDVVAGTDVRAARFHQTGTRFMPQRTILSQAAVTRSGAASQAVASWIVDGKARITA